MSVLPTEGSDEFKRKMTENHIKYLHGLSTLEALDNPILRSQFLIQRRLMELRSNIFLPNNVSKTNQRCSRCLLEWIDGPAKYRVKSKPKHKLVKKITKKLECGLPLTDYQQKYLKKMDTFEGNFLVITCWFCKKETKIKMEKPKKIEEPKSSIVSKQKKKRKRDKFCGLNPDVVLAARANMTKDTNESDTASLDSEIPETPKYKMSKTERGFQNVTKCIVEKQTHKSGLNEIVFSTPHNTKILDNSATISLDSDIPETPKFKLSKRDSGVQNVPRIETNESLLKKKNKKKKKNLSKLSAVLNSTSKTSSPAASLKQFLKSL